MDLTNPVTGHRIRTDEASVAFWQAAGYRLPVEQEKPKAAPRKRSAKKSN